MKIKPFLLSIAIAASLYAPTAFAVTTVTTCPTGQTYNSATLQCEAPTPPAQPTASTNSGNYTFVPLTNLPGLPTVANSASLPGFLNNLYKICIGLAAVLAVLQIMRAGFMFMTNKGSVSSNEAAKSLITQSILGLVLVLSPVIVFGIIDPSILKLNLDASSLQTSTTTWFTTGSTTASTTADINAANSKLGSIPTFCSVGYSDTAQANIPPGQTPAAACRTAFDADYAPIDNACCPGIVTTGIAGVDGGNVCCGKGLTFTN